jgi:hypothetical protein
MEVGLVEAEDDQLHRSNRHEISSSDLTNKPFLKGSPKREGSASSDRDELATSPARCDRGFRTPDRSAG